MNTTMNHARLDRLVEEIDALQDLVLDIERASLEMFDGSEDFAAVTSAAVIEAKAKLHQKLLAYVAESEVVRSAERSGRRVAA